MAANINPQGTAGLHWRELLESGRADDTAAHALAREEHVGELERHVEERRARLLAFDPPPPVGA